MAQSAEERLDRVAELAAEVAKNARLREESMSERLTEHTRILGDMRVTLARIDGRTESLVKDVGKLEGSVENQQKQIDKHSDELGIIKGVGTGITAILAAAIAFFHK
jgi:chromosome segregation ATPase